jgi:hypothetical protein
MEFVANEPPLVPVVSRDTLFEVKLTGAPSISAVI